MAEILGLDHDVYFGRLDEEPVDWRKHYGLQTDPDDEEMAKTPADVVAVLGFDPKELDDEDGGGKVAEHLPGQHDQSDHGNREGNGGDAAPEPITKTSAFRNWFGDSKVVSPSGEPLIVYKAMHPYDWTQEKDGEPVPEIESIDRQTEFPAFHGNEPGVKIAGFFGSRDIANQFASSAYSGMNAIFPVYLSLQNPYVINAQGRKAGDVQFGANWREFRDAIRSGKYDGVIIANTEDEGDLYVPLRPHQIKSAIGNRGTFDPDNPKLTESTWDEDKHPRDRDGRFTDGPDQNDGGKYRREPRELPPEYDTPDPPAPDTSPGSPAWKSARAKAGDLVYSAVRELPEGASKPHYRASAGRVLDRMNAKCLQRVAILAVPRFYGTEEALHAAWSIATGKPASEAYAKGVSGFFSHGKPGVKGVINVDGDLGDMTTEQVFAHESAHAIDSLGVYSGEDEWYFAWGHEIVDGDVKLSDYAKDKPSEGFAEFGRLVWSNPAAAERHFPRCWAFWKKHELV